MRRCFLLLILLASSLFSGAKEISVSLADQKLSKASKGFFIEDVVVSQREDSCLGYLHPEGPNKCIALYFKKNIHQELREFLVGSFPRQNGLNPLIIRVNRIFLYQASEGVRDYACLDLCLSFIRPENGLTEDFTSAVTVRKEQQFYPRRLDRLITDAFDSCLSQYDRRARSGLMIPVVIKPSQLNENPTHTAGYFRCYAGKQSGKGIYRTYFDFRDDRPDTTIDFKVFHDYNKNHPRLSKAWLKFPNDPKPGKCWGFYEGDSLYINGGRSYSLLTFEGDQFITYHRSSEYAREVTTAAIIGGVFGGFLGASFLGGLAAVSSDPDVIDKFRLDLFDGRLLSYEATDYTMVSSKVVLFASKKSIPGSTLKVFVDGKFQCELQAGNYSTFDLSCHHTNAKIKIVSSTGSESEIKIPLKLFKTEMYLLKVKKNNVIFTDRLYGQLKSDMLKDMTKENTVFHAELFN